MKSHDKISRNSLVSEYPCKWVKNMDFKDFRDYHITDFFVFLCVCVCVNNNRIWCAENELMKIQLTSNISDDCSCTGTICIWSVFTTDKRWRILFISCSEESCSTLYIMPATKDHASDRHEKRTEADEDLSIRTISMKNSPRYEKCPLVFQHLRSWIMKTLC